MEPPPAPASLPSPRTERASRRVLAAVVVIILVSALVRVVSLDRFSATVFDEYYYVHDANVMLTGQYGPNGAQSWKPGQARSAAHPDAGKLLIAAGILVFGDDPWGWRLPSALAGTALIALIYPLARRLGLAPGWALAALVLAAADSMLIVESRLGVLDIFVALWGVLAIYTALRWSQAGWARGWGIVTGLALGMAVATKWSGALAVLAVMAVVAFQLRGGAGRRSRDLVLRTLSLAPAALAVYLLAAVPYLAAGHSVGDWLHLQGHMLTFNWNVQGNRSFASVALTWPFDVHPIWYRWMLTDKGTVGLLAIGNPLLWWGSVVALVWLGVIALTRRDRQAAVLVTLVLVLYVPWLLTSRQSYIYYMTPVVPLMAVLVAAAISRGVKSSKTARFLAVGYVAATVAVAVAVGPFLLGYPVPFEYYDRLMLFTTWR